MKSHDIYINVLLNQTFMTWSHENLTIIGFSHRPFLRLNSKIYHKGCTTFQPTEY